MSVWYGGCDRICVKQYIGSLTAILNTIGICIDSRNVCELFLQSVFNKSWIFFLSWTLLCVFLAAAWIAMNPLQVILWECVECRSPLTFQCCGPRSHIFIALLPHLRVSIHIFTSIARLLTVKRTDLHTGLRLGMYLRVICKERIGKEVVWRKCPCAMTGVTWLLLLQFCVFQWL